MNENVVLETKPIHTVEQLRCLRRGERLTYYRGDLAADMARAEKDGGVPNYAKVLRALATEAYALEAAGRIRLVTETVKVDAGVRPKPAERTDHIAIGLVRG